MAKAVGYGRFSSEMQDGFSLDTQFSKIKEAAAKEGDEIIDWFKDEAETGKVADRKDFMRMYNAIKSGALKVENIYVYKFSRFMRNSAESHYFKMQLEALGVDVVSAMEPMPENEPLAELMERIIEATDAFQSGVIGSHVLSAMEELAARGYWTGGPARFGFRILEIDNREGHLCKGQIVRRSTLTPDEREIAAWGKVESGRSACAEYVDGGSKRALPDLRSQYFQSVWIRRTSARSDLRLQQPDFG